MLATAQPDSGQLDLLRDSVDVVVRRYVASSDTRYHMDIQPTAPEDGNETANPMSSEMEPKDPDCDDESPPR